MTVNKPNSYLWIAEAISCIGLSEVKGAKHSSKIVGWLKSLKAWWSDDETPWCGTFAAHCMTVAGVKPPKHWYRAKDWLNWGLVMKEPVCGCVVVFNRVGGGHVGFVVGKDKSGNIMVLGGNQGDAVNVKAFQPLRVAGYRWPTEIPVPRPGALPVLAQAEVSTNEA